VDPTVIIRPEIALDDFLPIFLSSSFVLLFGLFYVAIYALVKMGLIKSLYMPAAYLFWGAQTYSMYLLSVLLSNDPFTTKILILAMFGYLVLPHLYYHLNVQSEKRYERSIK